MTLMQRRRALMGAGDKGIPIKELENGTSFQTDISSPYKYVKFYASTAGQIVLAVKEYLEDTPVAIGSVARYNGSGVDSYCNAMASAIPAKLYNNLRDYTFSCRYSDDGTAKTESLTRKIFIPTVSFCGDTGIMMRALKTFYNTTNANAAREARTQASATNRIYWNCDSATDGSNTMYCVGAAGNAYNLKSPTSTYYIRPVFCLSDESKVTTINGIYVLV